MRPKAASSHIEFAITWRGGWARPPAKTRSVQRCPLTTVQDVGPGPTTLQRTILFTYSPCVCCCIGRSDTRLRGAGADGDAAPGQAAAHRPPAAAAPYGEPLRGQPGPPAHRHQEPQEGKRWPDTMFL